MTKKPENWLQRMEVIAAIVVAVVVLLVLAYRRFFGG
jgi:hypothetical protein